MQLVFKDKRSGLLYLLISKGSVQMEKEKQEEPVNRGVAKGGYIGIYTLPKSVPDNYFVH